MGKRSFSVAIIIVGTLSCGSCCLAGHVCVKPDRACLPEGTAVCIPPISSWSRAVSWTPRVVTVSEIHKTFAKLDGKGNDSCCPRDAWKRALPSKWAEHKEHFVQVNRLHVLSADSSASKDLCKQDGQSFGDAHVMVESKDDPAAGHVTVEFDRCWWANGICDARTLPKKDDIIDVQGFVTWDGPTDGPCPDKSDACWEIHPVSGWRFSIDNQKSGQCGPR
jgi:hypothetical protein